ncbi:MAG: riboflavin kinase [Spirochaetes bacterium]|uniref:riboflavin kinase n=1 Tax=Candidatus Ornithospirochaeta stercoripullorum TaxID=2840899 RepID=A0A9D9E0U3_9SPIO|nr:riboflavin kinase [Candidatus Ornithospirochaeta stercoripullorum]
MQYISVLTGKVIHGKGLGRTVGMPTANLQPARGSEIPPQGVYASLVHIKDGVYIGVTNIGERPTVDNDSRFTIETNINSFDKDIYGETMTLTILYFLRPIKKMKSLKEVKEQVDKDMAKAIALISQEKISQ